jgi:hypothetical protein
MPEKKEYRLGKCEECGGPMKLKPADRKFCKARCRYAHSNRTRGRVTGDSAQTWFDDHLMTVPDAVRASGLSETTIRRMVKANRLHSKRMYGRVLLYRSQVEVIRRSATNETVPPAARQAVAESAAATNNLTST